MGKDRKKDDETKDPGKDTKALSWRERMNPDTAGSRWDLSTYKEMDDRKKGR